MDELVVVVVYLEPPQEDSLEQLSRSKQAGERMSEQGEEITRFHLPVYHQSVG